MTLTNVVQAYWMPGCSSCLRMKEFISKSGREWVAINADEDLEARAELEANGHVLPVARLGDRWVNGVDLPRFVPGRLAPERRQCTLRHHPHDDGPRRSRRSRASRPPRRSTWTAHSLPAGSGTSHSRPCSRWGGR